MAVVPSSHDFTSGVATTSEANAYIRDPIAFLLNRPVADVYSTVAQSIPSGAFTSVLFELEAVDTDPDGTGGHSTSSNTSRYTARYAGWYTCSGKVSYDVNATSYRGATFAVNGTAVARTGVLMPNNGAAMAMVVVLPDHEIFLNVGDYVEVQGIQGSGAPLNTATALGWYASMKVEWSRNA